MPGINANEITLNFGGGFEGYFSDPPLNFGHRQFGFTIYYRGTTNCVIERLPVYVSLPSPTPTPMPTSTYAITPTTTPTFTTTPTTTPTCSPGD
jgi:hypothetical protein